MAIKFSTFLTKDGFWKSADNTLFQGTEQFKAPQPTTTQPKPQPAKPVLRNQATSLLKTTGQAVAKTVLGPVLGSGIGLKSASTAVRFGKEGLQSIPRNIASVALTGANALTPKRAEQEIPVPKLLRSIFGTDRIKSLPLQVEETKNYIEGSPTAKKYGLDKYALPLAFAGVVGGSSLDFLPGGSGGSKFAKQIAASTDPKAISQLLREGIGIADNIAGKYAPQLARITDPAQVSTVLKTLLEEQGVGRAATQAARTGTKERGFVSSVKQEFPEIEKVAGQYIPRNTDRLAIQARNLVQSDIGTAERIARTATDDDAVAIASELIKHYADEAAKATDDATKLAIHSRAAEIANDIARKLTEQGRSVQAAAILGRLTPEGQVRFAAKEIQKYNEAIEAGRGGILGLRKKIPELSGAQADQILTEMRAIEGMPDGIEKAMRFQKLQNTISDLVPSSLYQKIVAVWKAGLLTGLKTSGLNIMSNLSHATLETVKDVPAVAIDSVASLFTKKRTVGMTVRGAAKGTAEGFQKGWRYLKTGFDERNIGAKLDYKRVNFGSGRIAKGLQKYEETIFRVIGAEDQPFYYGAKARSLYGQAIAQAKNASLKGAAAKEFIDALIQNPTDAMVRYAVLDAETAVFQNKTVLGAAAKQIQGVPAGEFVVPFGRTPSAVATQIINYSPVGIVATLVRNIGKGRFDQRLFSQALGRGLVGTGILFVGVELFRKGLMSLNRPTTEREQELWNAEGRSPNSIKIGDKWRSAQVLGPAGNLLIVGGHFQNEFLKSGSPTEAISNAIFGSAKSFSEQTFLRGVSDLLEALSDPKRAAEGYFGNLLASAVPTLSSDVARATDPKERRVETSLERVQARVPGLRRGLEPQVTSLGEERESVGNPLEIMADPTRPSKDISTPLVQELRRLTDAGFAVAPTKLGDKKGFKALTQEQNTQLWKRSGSIVNEKLTNLITHEAYQELPDDLKEKKINEFVDKSKMFARVELVLQLTEGLEGDALLSKLSELKKGGLLTKEVFENYAELR